MVQDALCTAVRLTVLCSFTLHIIDTSNSEAVYCFHSNTTFIVFILIFKCQCVQILTYSSRHTDDEALRGFLGNAACIETAPHPITYIAFIPLFILGLLAWSLFEYGLHRGVFHISVNTTSALSITSHFMIHGQHHKFPLDKRMEWCGALIVLLIGILL